MMVRDADPGGVNPHGVLDGHYALALAGVDLCLHGDQFGRWPHRRRRCEISRAVLALAIFFSVSLREKAS